MKKTVIIYSLVLLFLLFLLKLVEYKFFVGSLSVEIYIGIIALAFTVLGIWIGHSITNKKRTQNQINKQAIIELEISSRELEVLELMVGGCSNQEIADKLFISLSTVKTHTSNLFSKMAVKRRTQAIQKALELQLVNQTENFHFL